MVVGDAVNLMIHVDSEGNTVQAFVADAASETTRMIGLPHGLQDLCPNEV